MYLDVCMYVQHTLHTYIHVATHVNFGEMNIPHHLYSTFGSYCTVAYQYYPYVFSPAFTGPRSGLPFPYLFLMKRAAHNEGLFYDFHQLDYQHEAIGVEK